MKPHVMIDIETMGNGNEAAIISIGAAKFNPYDYATVLDKFYVPVSLQSSVSVGLKIDASTVLWWLHEDREDARKALLDETAVDIYTALDGFSQWFGTESLPTWGNGATFDNVIVRSAMKKCGIPCPWEFWDDRCFRTMKNLVPVPVPLPVPDGVPHHALYDAVKQVYHLQAVYRMTATGAVAA